MLRQLFIFVSRSTYPITISPKQGLVDKISRSGVRGDVCIRKPRLLSTARTLLPKPSYIFLSSKSASQFPVERAIDSFNGRVGNLSSSLFHLLSELVAVVVLLGVDTFIEMGLFRSIKCFVRLRGTTLFGLDAYPEEFEGE